jgi:hypothetical protein
VELASLAKHSHHSQVAIQMATCFLINVMVLYVHLVVNALADIVHLHYNVVQNQVAILVIIIVINALVQVVFQFHTAKVDIATVHIYVLLNHFNQ